MSRYPEGTHRDDMTPIDALSECYDLWASGAWPDSNAAYNLEEVMDLVHKAVQVAAVETIRTMDETAVLQVPPYMFLGISSNMQAEALTDAAKQADTELIRYEIRPPGRTTMPSDHKIPEDDLAPVIERLARLLVLRETDRQDLLAAGAKVTSQAHKLAVARLDGIADATYRVVDGWGPQQILTLVRDSVGEVPRHTSQGRRAWFDDHTERLAMELRFIYRDALGFPRDDPFDPEHPDWRPATAAESEAYHSGHWPKGLACREDDDQNVEVRPVA